MKGGLVKSIRRKLGMTQARLAEVMGVSAKAVQSYEQGWRNVPTPIASQLLVLLAIHRHREEAARPCWEVAGCSITSRRGCPSHRVSRGQFCWLVSGGMCGRGGNPSGKHCLDCAVVRRLLLCQGAADEMGVEHD
jgi:DNA-binding XRE family transcriptional regulator